MFIAISFISALCICLLLDQTSLVAADLAPFNNSQKFKDGVWGNYPRQHFLSHRRLNAPVPNLIVPPQEGASPSKHILWTPASPNLPRTNPMVLDTSDLSVVWYGPRMGWETLGATVQECNNTKYITFWSGTGAEGWKEGMYYMMNEHYELAYTIAGQGNLTHADAHELSVTPQCTAIFTSYQDRPSNVTLNGVETQYNLESYFQEIDIATGEIIFQWNASQHVDVQDTLWNSTIRDEGRQHDYGFDWFHINSVEKDARGNYLVGSRHMNAIYYVSGRDGTVIWQLGGKRNSFKDMNDGAATDFSWQHHARWVGGDLSKLSLFDNRNTQWHPDSRQPVSRGLILHLDYERMEVSIHREYTASSGIVSWREGSMQVLDDSPAPGNVLLGYGQEPAFTEYTENGTIVWDVAFSPQRLDRHSPDNYRALKVNWTGRPLTRPSIAAGPMPIYDFHNETSSFNIRTTDGDGNHFINDTAYFSWNGATEVTSWVVLASNETAALDPRQHFWAEVPKRGFENHCFVGAYTKHVAVLAVDADDTVLGMSSIVDMGTAALQVALEPHVDGDGRDRYDTTELTSAWQAFVARQPRDSLFVALRSHWRALSDRARQAPVHVQIGASAVVGLLVLSSVAILLFRCLRRRNRSRGYARVGPSDEYIEFADSPGSDGADVFDIDKEGKYWDTAAEKATGTRSASTSNSEGQKSKST